MAHTDAELIQRILAGDPDAFSPLVKKYQKGVHTLVWRKIGDFHTAEEITQDAFLTAYQKLGTLKNHHQFAGWLYVIAANLCRDWLRKKRLPMDSLDRTDTNEVDKVSYSRYVAEKQKADADETRREIVRKLLQKLPESERTVMTLHYLGEMTINAISEFLGVSPNTIKSRLSRARNRLRKEEDIIRESLGSFQLSDTLEANIMREVSRTTLAPPAVSKPLLPWAISAASAVLLFLLMGIGTQYLSRFQKPYHFNATSEPTVEIIDALFIIDSPAKPAVRNQPRRSALPGKDTGAGQNPDESLFATLPLDTPEVSTVKSDWHQTQGPEGGRVQNLFIAASGDLYARAATDLYRLTDDRSRWSLVNPDMPSDSSWHIAERNGTLYLVSDTDIRASTDSGETWQLLGPRPEGILIDLVITAAAPGAQTDIRMYLALAEGVFASIDAGRSWLPVNDGTLKDRKIRAITAIENTLFVGTDQGLYRRDSEGWTLLPVGDSRNIRAVASAGHRLYVAVGERAVNQGFGFSIPTRVTLAAPLALYRSTDFGDSWEALELKKAETPASSPSYQEIRFGFAPPTPAPQGKADPTVEISGLTIQGANPESDPQGKAGTKDSELEETAVFKMVAVEESLFVLDDKNGYYSEDAGDTWVALDAKIPDSEYVATLVSSDPKTFYRNGQFGIYRTTDAGKTWHPFNTGVVKTTVIDLIALQQGLYANVDGDLLMSSNGGETWVPVASSTTALTNLATFNGVLYARGIEEKTKPSVLRLSTQDNRFIPIPEMPMLKEPSYAELVKEKVNETVSEIADTIAENEDKADFDVDALLQDYNQVIEETLGQLLPTFLGNFAVSGDTYYMEYNQKLFRWKTGTTDWVDTGIISADAPIATTESAYDLDFFPFTLAVSGSTVYIGKQGGHLFRSVDEGHTWTDVTAHLPFSVAQFRGITLAGATLYVATDKGVTYSSDGVQWHTTTDTEGTPLVIKRFAVAGTTVYGTSGRQVYQLKENARVWQPVAPEIPVPITALAVEGNVLYVGAQGKGVLRFRIDE